jgi:hypothetical protein
MSILKVILNRETDCRQNACGLSIPKLLNYPRHLDLYGRPNILNINVIILSRATGCGSVTNKSTWIRIGYRIYSLWRFTAAHITITENILTLALVAS